MSLRDFGIFQPLPPDHPIVLSRHTRKCWICGKQIVAGSRVALHSLRGLGFLIEPKIVCANCNLRGKPVLTPEGERVILRVLDGAGVPFVLETTDGKRWTDGQVRPV